MPLVRNGMDDYYRKTKEKLQNNIPNFDSAEFGKIRDRIRKELQKKESEQFILLRSLKILVLGDWFTQEKKQLLLDIKNKLLERGLYAETIDSYYDPKKSGGLSQVAILEQCCIVHQLIVFIDGDGKGTLTEQNYLSSNYIFHGKIVYFIDEDKFNSLKSNPSEYFKDFPTIITCRKGELIDKILAYSALRIYRLAGIIQKQTNRGRGLGGPDYEPWKKRLDAKRFKVQSQ
ncbi:MAG: hypothetical protein AABX01_08135 [Candidatus Micrarchaeota archaeon]